MLALSSQSQSQVGNLTLYLVNTVHSRTEAIHEDMALQQGIAGPMQFCRRLFTDTTPYLLVQQTLETVLRKDQERFKKKWNFPLITINQETENRAPTGQLNSQSSDESTDIDEARKCGWKLIQPNAQFYSTPPRKLKAHRRLAPTVAQKVRQQVLRASSETLEPSSINKVNLQSRESTMPFCFAQPLTGQSESHDCELADLFQPIQRAPRLNGLKLDNKPSSSPSTPVLIRSTQNDVFSYSTHSCEPVKQSVRQATPSAIARQPRHSLQVVKRKSMNKVTGK